METDSHFARLLADLPESLARDEVFVSELKIKAIIFSVPANYARMPIS